MLATPFILGIYSDGIEDVLLCAAHLFRIHTRSQHPNYDNAGHKQKHTDVHYAK